MGSAGRLSYQVVMSPSGENKTAALCELKSAAVLLCIQTIKQSDSKSFPRSRAFPKRIYLQL